HRMTAIHHALGSSQDAQEIFTPDSDVHDTRSLLLFPALIKEFEFLLLLERPKSVDRWLNRPLPLRKTPQAPCVVMRPGRAYPLRGAF
ncbi:MAG: hypothetical protein ABR587_09725, partial [Candidatus Binatia bacterium]